VLPTAAIDTVVPTASTEAQPVEPTVTSAPATGLVKGVVSEAAGAPLRDASVFVLEGSAPFPQMAVFTDVNGTYEWRLAPGTYTLAVARDGYTDAEQVVTVSAGTEVVADFQLQPAN
jgi:hypothetical protein